MTPNMILDPETKTREVSVFDHLELLSEIGRDFTSSRDMATSLLKAVTHITENDASGSSFAAAVNSLNKALSFIYSEFLTSISKLIHK